MLHRAYALEVADNLLVPSPVTLILPSLIIQISGKIQPAFEGCYLPI